MRAQKEPMPNASSATGTNRVYGEAQQTKRGLSVASNLRQKTRRSLDTRPTDRRRGQQSALDQLR